jgi:CRP-like cAMP-binding protein
MAALSRVSGGRQVVSAGKGEVVFSQGDPAATVCFMKAGRVKVSVVSSAGKEAVLDILGPGDFFGEECLIDQSERTSTVTAIEPSLILEVHKSAMLRDLHRQSKLTETFTISLLQRTVALTEDLCDHILNDSEKRLARVLLKLARKSEAGPDAIPALSHETLAEMVGTTRARITHFMNKFRRSGLIDYDGHLITITKSLTRVVLLD